MNEETVAVSAEGDLLVIRHSRWSVYDKKRPMEDTLVIAKSAASWLADRVVKCFNDTDGPYDFESGGDSLHVSFGGSDQEPCVNIINRRAETVARPGLFGMTGLSEPAAYELAGLLKKM